MSPPYRVGFLIDFTLKGPCHRQGEEVAADLEGAHWVPLVRGWTALQTPDCGDLPHSLLRALPHRNLSAVVEEASSIRIEICGQEEVILDSIVTSSNWETFHHLPFR